MAPCSPRSIFHLCSLHSHRSQGVFSLHPPRVTFLPQLPCRLNAPGWHSTCLRVRTLGGQEPPLHWLVWGPKQHCPQAEPSQLRNGPLGTAALPDSPALLQSTLVSPARPPPSCQRAFYCCPHYSECSPSTYRPSDILHARPLQEAFPDFRPVLVPVTAPSEHFPDYMSSSPLLGSMWPGAVSLVLPLRSSTSYRAWHRADAK